MNIPFTGSWIEWVLYVGAGVVLAIYTWQVVLPRVQHLFKPDRDSEERAAELLRRYHEQKANKLPPE